MNKRFYYALLVCVATNGILKAPPTVTTTPEDQLELAAPPTDIPERLTAKKVTDLVPDTEPEIELQELESEFNESDNAAADRAFAQGTQEAQILAVDKQQEELALEAQMQKQQVNQDRKKEGTTYLTSYTQPWRDMNAEQRINMQFDNADLVYLLDYLARAFKITFILDDNIKPPSPNAKLVAGNKITFKSQVPLSPQQVWEIGNTFLEMAGLAIVPLTEPRTYRVMATIADAGKPSANREPLPTYIGVDGSILPNSGKIRYVYFVENADPGTIKSVIDAMRSASSGPALLLDPMRAIIMTDQAANIKSILDIISELDRVTMPETLSVIKLNQADAGRVFELYKQLVQPADQQQPSYLFRPARKAETTSYFSKSLRIIPEPRTNTLIALGTRDAIKRFEDFIVTHIDKPVELPFSPLHIHQLKYLKAASIATILSDVIKFQQGEPAAQYGGVRGGEKFFKVGTTITPEPDGNRLIINAPYEDYLKLLEILEKMDVEQPQVAVKVLILNVDLTDTRAIGTQLRNKSCITDRNPAVPGSCTTEGCCGPTGILGQYINFQNTGFNGAGVVENGTANSTGAVRLLGNLLSLAQNNPQGTTLITLGQDMYGIFGILRLLQSFTRTTVIANPFVIATHKYKASLSIGQTMRLVSAIVSGVGGNVNSFTDISADLSVDFIPQISFNDNMVSLDINVTLNQFTDDIGSRNNKVIRTNALLTNGEVLALGGLITEEVDETTTKWPILGDIPILGYFFKNTEKTFTRTSLLILISPEIIKPHTQSLQDSLTQTKLNEAKRLLFDMRNPAERRDPVYRWFFKEEDRASASLDKFVARQQRYLDETQRPANAQYAQSSALIEKKKHTKSLVDLVNPKQATDTEQEIRA